MSHMNHVCFRPDALSPTMLHQEVQKAEGLVGSSQAVAVLTDFGNTSIALQRVGRGACRPSSLQGSPAGGPSHPAADIKPWSAAVCLAISPPGRELQSWAAG